MAEEGLFRTWRLPALGGWALRIYTLLWLALLAAALGATLLGVIASAWDGPSRIPLLRAGINYTRDGGPGLVVFDVSSAEARAAGIGGGDRIVGINRAADVDEGLDEIVEAEEGDTILLHVQDAPGAAPRAVTLAVGEAQVETALRSAGFSGRFMAGWTLGVMVFSNLFGIAAAILLFRGQRRNPVAALLALIPLLIAAAGYEALPLAAAYGIVSLTQILLPIALLAFPDGRFPTRVSRALLAANLLWAPVVFFDIYRHSEGAVVLLIVSAAAVAWRIRRSPTADERQQLRWAMLGFAGAALAALALLVCGRLQYLSDDLRYVIVNDMASDAFDTLTTVCLWGGLIVALLRYRLYDADVAITRSAVWALAAPLLAFFFAATIEVLKVALGPVFGNDMVVVPSAGALTALLIEPVGGWIERRVESWSRRDLIALGEELPAAAADLAERDEPGPLLDHACQRIARAMKAKEVAIALRGASGWALGAATGEGDSGAWPGAAALGDAALETAVDRGDRRFPLRVPLVARPAGEPEAIGWLLIGPRPDGSVQDKDARTTVAAVAPSIAHALHVIAMRRGREQALLARLKAAREARNRPKKQGGNGNSVSAAGRRFSVQT